MSVKRMLSVKIPPGVLSGQAVRVTGEGEPPSPEASPGGQGIRGDLHVVVRVRPHEHFERDGDHLLLAVSLGFSQLALGATVEIPTLEATTMLTVPPGTQHGSMLRIGDQGLPSRRTGRRGDLIVIVQLIVPKKLTDDQKELLEQFAETEEVDVATGDKASLWNRIKDAMTGG